MQAKRAKGAYTHTKNEEGVVNKGQHKQRERQTQRKKSREQRKLSKFYYKTNTIKSCCEQEEGQSQAESNSFAGKVT